VEVAELGAAERADGEDLRGRHADDRRGLRAGGLLDGVGGAFPGHKSAVGPQEGGGVLDYHGESGQGADGDHVVGVGPVVLCPILGAGGNRSGVAQAGGGGEARDDGCLAPGGLDQVDLGVGKRDCQSQARKAGAGAEVGDACGASQSRHLEAGETVGDMAVECRRGVRDSCMGIRLGGQGFEQRGDALGGVLGESEASGKGLDRFS